MVLSPEANPELALDSDDDDVPVPLTTSKAQVLASMSVVQEYMNLNVNCFVANDFHATSHVLKKNKKKNSGLLHNHHLACASSSLGSRHTPNECNHMNLKYCVERWNYVHANLIDCHVPV